MLILSKQWQEGRLSPPVQTEMTKLTKGKLNVHSEGGKNCIRKKNQEDLVDLVM